MEKTLKLICILLSVLLVITLGGCGKNDKDKANSSNFEDSYEDIEDTEGIFADGDNSASGSENGGANGSAANGSSTSVSSQSSSNSGGANGSAANGGNTSVNGQSGSNGGTNGSAANGGNASANSQSGSNGGTNGSAANGGNASANSQSGSNSGTNGSAANGGNTSGSGANDFDISELEGLFETGGDKTMSIPSRANTYKLTNTYNKLKSGEDVKVAYYGGSVTSGTGSSNGSTNSWRALTTAYIKTLAKGKVTEVDAALGGSASFSAAARFEYQIIHNKVDLLFIEFAINDYYNDIPQSRIKSNLEYMIAKLNAHNPNADIVFVLITNKTTFGSQYGEYLTHVEVANHYKIPVVDIGGEVYNALGGSSAKFADYLADSVHPNDAGHKLYSEIMIKALKELLVSGTTSPHSLPAKKLSKGAFTTIENLKPSAFANGEWKEKSWFDDNEIEKSGSQFRYSKLKEQFHTYLTPTSSGVTLTINFTGNSFGFLGTLKDGSSLKIVLDSKSEKNIDGTGQDELYEYPVFDELSNSAHTVTITAYGDPPKIAIASFVVTR